MIKRPPTALLLAPLVVLAVLIPAGKALADATATGVAPEPSAPVPQTTTVPAPPSSEPTQSTPTTTSTSPAPPASTTGETTTVPAPELRAQRPQPPTAGAQAHRHTATTQPLIKPETKPGGGNANAQAVAPSALTPPLPSTLGGSLSGVPSFFINSFSIPPFLLPIYQAAGAAYGIPWQVLAAINEVETDYGRDLSVSSAGAEGWMQFLPSTWVQYGVDVNNNGFEDPYNPADAIFAAARYLEQAGGDRDIRAAVFSYNHSQAYVKSVLLRARLLGGTPPQLLGAVTGLTEARFPVYAASHYSDGFPISEGPSSHTVPGTTIYSQGGAPVIAVQDGRVVQIDETGPLGRTISLTDAYGNTYTYGGVGTLATLYPVLEAFGSGPPADLRATGLSSSAFGSDSSTQASSGATRVFRAGSENVYLHPLRIGAQVIAGTVLGHLNPGREAHIVFQIRPAGAPLVDPKPILDGWVKLQSSSAVKAKGREPFARISPTAGQALLESKTQLEQQVARDRAIHLAPCERRLIGDGRADRRVLAALEFLAASGLKPTVSTRSCRQTSGAGTGATFAGAVGGAVDISAINGLPLAGSSGSTSIAAVTVRKLGALQGIMKPLQIASSMRFGGATHTVLAPRYTGLIHIAYSALGGGQAHTASAVGTGLTPAQWLALVARLGQVPDPTVSSKPSSAAIPDHSGASSVSPTEGR